MILTCLHCGVMFAPPRTPIIGESKDVTMGRVMDQAGQHMAKKHPEHWAPMVTAWVPKLGFLWLMLNTKTKDEEMIRTRNLTCGEFVRLCGRNVTDEEIREAVDKARMVVGADGRGEMTDLIPVNTVIRMMTELRNLLRFEDLFPPDPKPPIEMEKKAA